MVSLATQGSPWFLPSAMELREEGTSYTILTVNRVREQLGPTAEIYFVMGMDSWREIETWRDHRKLLESCSIILLPRDGVETADRDSVVTEVHDIGGEPPAGRGVFSLVTGEVEISSTSIRERATRGESVTGLVPESVGRYLEKQGLYGNTGTGR